MNSIFPIVAAVLQASSFTLDKVILSIRNVTYKTYIGASYPLIFVVTLLIFFIIRPPLPESLFTGRLLGLLLLSVVLQIGTNLIFYRALDHDDLGEIQTIELLRNFPIIIGSSLAFPDERKTSVVLLALIASLAIVWSHWERHHFKFARRTKPFLIWSLSLAPLSAGISKLLLQSWHPVSLELVRAGLVSVILCPLFLGKTRNVSLKALGLLVLTNVLTTIAWILFYFSYQRAGIIYTTLLFSIQPLLVYGAGIVLLKEKLQPKRLAAFAIVLASIVIAQVF